MRPVLDGATQPRLTISSGLQGCSVRWASFSSSSAAESFQSAGNRYRVRFLNHIEGGPAEKVAKYIALKRARLAKFRRFKLRPRDPMSPGPCRARQRSDSNGPEDHHPAMAAAGYFRLR